MKRPHWQRAPILLSILLVVALAGLELGLRRLPAPPAPDLASLAFAQAQEGDLYVFDPDLFWRLRPDQVGRYAGVEVRTNSLGLRGGEPRSPSVVCLGDSVTFGYQVAEGLSWPRQLEQATGHEVLVAAVPGYSSHQGRRLLEQVLERFRPAVVIVSFGYNDARLSPFSDHQAAQGARLRAAAWLRRSALVGHTAALFGDGARAARAREVLRLRAGDLARFPPRDREQARGFQTQEARIRKLLARAPERVSLDRYAENLSAMATLARDRGAEVIFLGPPYGGPSLEPYFAASRHRTPVAAYRERMRELARIEEVAYVALPQLSESAGSAMTRLFVTRSVPAEEQAGLALLGLSGARLGEMGYLPGAKVRTDLAHPSPAGHARIAEALLPLVSARLGAVPPASTAR